MNNIKQALKSAIKAMLSMEATIARNLGVSISDDEANAVLECKAALAELDKCEPVKGVIISEGSPTLLSDKYIKATDIRLYTFPPQQQWVGLSDDDIHNLADHSFTFASGQFDEIFKFANAIETKLKELNT